MKLVKRKKAETLIDALKQRSKTEYVPPVCFIPYYLLQGDNDQAYDWLEKAIDEHDTYIYLWISLPIDEYGIPDDPRFYELLKKVGYERKGE